MRFLFSILIQSTFEILCSNGGLVSSFSKGCSIKLSEWSCIDYELVGISLQLRKFIEKIMKNLTQKVSENFHFDHDSDGQTNLLFFFRSWETWNSFLDIKVWITLNEKKTWFSLNFFFFFKVNYLKKKFSNSQGLIWEILNSSPSLSFFSSFLSNYRDQLSWKTHLPTTLKEIRIKFAK